MAVKKSGDGSLDAFAKHGCDVLSHVSEMPYQHDKLGTYTGKQLLNLSALARFYWYFSLFGIQVCS